MSAIYPSCIYNGGVMCSNVRMESSVSESQIANTGKCLNCGWNPEVDMLRKRRVRLSLGMPEFGTPKKPLGAVRTLRICNYCMDQAELLYDILEDIGEEKRGKVDCGFCGVRRYGSVYRARLRDDNGDGS